jgi:hypothetical protein
MTLWDLLTVISFVMPISGAMASAQHAHVGFWGYATALLLSLILGVACGWAVRASSARVAMTLGDNPKTFGNWLYLGAYCCASALWPFFALFLGGWATSSVFEFLR